MKYTTDVRTFDDLERIQRNVADNHRPKPAKVIEVCLTSTSELQTSYFVQARRQVDLQRAASSSSTINNMEKVPSSAYYSL